MVTLYLLSQARASTRVLSYISGIFLTYLAVGILSLLGLDAFLTYFEDALNSPVAYAIEGVIGAALLIYSFLPSSTSKKSKQGQGKQLQEPSVRGLAGVFLLGVSITFVELLTAIPYFAAIAILTNAALPTSQWLSTLVIYNIIFVLPPMLLLIGHIILGERLGTRYVSLRERLQRGAHETMLWIIGGLGFLLLMDSLNYFDFLHFF